jgi:preprotein translocase subunit SecF
MFIVNHRRIFYIFSIVLALAGLFFTFFYGLKLGIDFTGGSLLEVEYQNARPEISALQKNVESLNIGNASLQPTGDRGLIVRSKDLSEEQHQQLLAKLNLDNKNPVIEKRFDSIGPVIGSELKSKSITGIIIVAIVIILYVAFAFRKVSQPVSSFYYGLFAVVALIHDITIPTGIFAALGHYYGVEVDILFVTALLTVLGFSVHDTIVVYDRTRENLRKGIGRTFEETVGISLKQTIVRSINTSFTVLLVLLAIFLYGGASTKYFSLALMIGVVFGTYSSIFLASPLLVTLHKWQLKRSGKK